MANHEYVEVLKQGGKTWNEWRKARESAYERHMLEQVGWSSSDESNLRPDLTGADLSSRILWYADLRDANLDGANLEGADLTGANLDRASLRAANLVRSSLESTSLLSADLLGANLQRAEFGGTILGSTDLRGALNLTSCRFNGPCTIDHFTIRRSWPLPLSFLRGCGLDDTFIEYIPSLINQPIQFYSCFISYSSKDEEFAKRLHADLQDRHVRCWFAPEDMKIGDKIRSAIDTAIRLREKLLVILSEHSIASPWVEAEVEKALEEEGRKKAPVLFPVRVDDAVMHTDMAWAAMLRRQRHIGDFTRWKEHDPYQEALKRLLRDLTIDGQGTQSSSSIP